MASNPALKEKRAQFLARIKAAVHGVEPYAEMIIYGSRARGDAQPDSDWDFLILVEGDIPEERQQAIRRQLLEIELDSSEVLCSIIRNRQEWDHQILKAMPFYQNVRREGIWL